MILHRDVWVKANLLQKSRSFKLTWRLCCKGIKTNKAIQSRRSWIVSWRIQKKSKKTHTKWPWLPYCQALGSSPSLLISCTKWLFNPRSEKRHRFSSSNIRNRSQISTSWSSHGGCSWRREQQIVNRSWKVKSQQKHQDEHTQEK